MKISELKVGDTVFVVQQNRRGDTGERTSFETVTKVGRRYAHINVHGVELPFYLSTGISAHKACNARENGCGFDVYVNEEEYRQKQFNAMEKARLEKRIVDRWGKLVDDLPSHVVDKFNDILDECGFGKGAADD